jgi:hypothetical protein|tara:strand:+ start:2126 stop:2290 length:165 start_codon:yes stop_codon:yes gene_type:complete
VKVTARSTSRHAAKPRLAGRQRLDEIANKKSRLKNERGCDLRPESSGELNHPGT